MRECFENTAWTGKSSLSFLPIKNFEEIFECLWEDKEQLCPLFVIKSRLHLRCVARSPACGGRPSPVSPTSAHPLVESGFLVAVPGPGRTPSPTNGSWLFLTCVQVEQKERMGECRLVGLASRGVAGDEGGWQRPDPADIGPGE